MNNNFSQIIDALLELRASSIRAHANFEEEIHKYNIAFAGHDLNMVDTITLANALNTKFNILISHEELLDLIPSLCDALSMKYEPIKYVKNIGLTEHDAYSIFL